METNCLYPPNNKALSDIVIGNFMQPARKFHDVPTVEINCREETGQRDFQQSSLRHQTSKQRVSTTGSEVYQLQLTETAMTKQCLTSGTTSRHNYEDGYRSKSKPHETSSKPSRSSPNVSIVTKEDQQKIRHRERCRVNQGLYRQRQRKMVQNLETKIQKLQKEIRILNHQSHRNSPVPTTQSLWVVATQYFHHYQNFSLSPPDFRDTAHEFLQATMAPDMICGAFTGVEALLESWSLFSLYFDRIQVTLAGLNSYDSNTLVASTIISLTFSSNSFVYAFPHLSNNGHGSFGGKKRSQFATRLLGQRIIMRGTVRFCWDSSSNRVVRLLSQADMLSPLLSLLGNLHDVSHVFEDARVTPDWNLVAN